MTNWFTGAGAHLTATIAASVLWVALVGAVPMSPAFGQTERLGAPPDGTFDSWRAECPEGTWVGGAEIGTEGRGYVSHIGLTCVDADLQDVAVADAGYGPYVYDSGRSDCAGIATGIHGRAGDIIDAFGLRCEGEDAVLVGGGGGDAQVIDCPDGHRLYGLDVTGQSYFGGPVLWSVQGLCVELPIPTELVDLEVTAPASATGSGDPGMWVNATLQRRDGTPVTDRTVRFTAGEMALCDAVTDESGRASCALAPLGVYAMIADRGFDAVFDGDREYEPSTARRTVL